MVCDVMLFLINEHFSMCQSHKLMKFKKKYNELMKASYTFIFTEINTEIEVDFNKVNLIKS